MKRLLSAALFAALAVLWSAATVSALDPAVMCEASKLKTAGKYDLCRLNEAAKAARTLSQPDFGRCDAKFSDKWTTAEARGMGQCPSSGDEAAIQAFVTQHTDDLAAALAGGPLPDCSGNLATCTSDLTTCNSGLGTCNTNLAATTASLTTCNGSLSTCNGDLATCNTNLSSTTASLTTCNTTLTTCNTNLTAALACGNGAIDGGEQCDQANLNGATCVTQGFAGGALVCSTECAFDTAGCWSSRFIDNGDGTITDNQTGLMWEKKDDLGGIHDKDNVYPWSTGPPWGMTGTAFTTFLGTLNYGASDDGGTTMSGCFAGHCDWRLPTITELRGILLAPYPCGTTPCIDPVFGPINPTWGWWSSTSSASNPSVVWWVNFFDGLSLGGGLKRDVAANCRAVRGGF